MPQSLDDQYRAAMRLHQQGNAREARRAYDRILAVRPDHAGVIHLKGVLALQAHDYDTAIDLISRSLRIQPRHELAWSNLSVALRAKGRLYESIAALEKAIAINPTAESLTNLAQTQSESGRIREFDRERPAGHRAQQGPAGRAAVHDLRHQLPRRDGPPRAARRRARIRRSWSSA